MVRFHPCLATALWLGAAVITARGDDKPAAPTANEVRLVQESGPIAVSIAFFASVNGPKREMRLRMVNTGEVEIAMPLSQGTFWLRAYTRGGQEIPLPSHVLVCPTADTVNDSTGWQVIYRELDGRGQPAGEPQYACTLAVPAKSEKAVVIQFSQSMNHALSAAAVRHGTALDVDLEIRARFRIDEGKDGMESFKSEKRLPLRVMLPGKH